MCKSKPWDTAEDETKGIGMMNKGQVMKGGTSDIHGEQFRGTSMGAGRTLSGTHHGLQAGLCACRIFPGISSRLFLCDP